MKRIIAISAIVILALLAASRGVVNALHKSESQDTDLSLTVKTPKEVFSLGEIVPLTFKFTNETSESIRFFDILHIEDGDIQILISQDGGNFKKYSHSRWGVADVNRPPISLKSHESRETSVGILWNDIPNELNIDRVADKQLVTNYAFQTKGIYLIKAKTTIHYSDKEAVWLESAPIQIVVEEPTGDNLAVWNKIKDRGDIGFFLQEGDFKSYDPKERAKLQKEVEQLLVQYPNSIFADPIKESLKKHQENEEKAKPYLEQIKQDKQNRSQPEI